MRVLSLFDGIGCGRQALKDAGINVTEYYASEIDEKAIEVARHNHSDIVHIGDVRGVNASNLPPIDLLIGGSPCQGFSAAGRKLGTKDPRSGLIKDYYRLIDELWPTWFLLENVLMAEESRNEISETLGVQPMMIDSGLFVPQTRRRLYWTDIDIPPLPTGRPTLSEALIDRRLCEDITERFHSKKYGTRACSNAYNFIRTPREQARCLMTRGQDISNTGATNVLTGGKVYRLHPVECERLQGLPDGYTDGYSRTLRYHMLGNGWTVPVIAHILSGIDS
jgi:site-specific DNA-cytosine methylase